MHVGGTGSPTTMERRCGLGRASPGCMRIEAATALFLWEKRHHAKEEGKMVVQSGQVRSW